MTGKSSTGGRRRGRKRKTPARGAKSHGKNSEDPPRNEDHRTEDAPPGENANASIAGIGQDHGKYPQFAMATTSATKKRPVHTWETNCHWNAAIRFGYPFRLHCPRARQEGDLLDRWCGAALTTKQNPVGFRAWKVHVQSTMSCSTEKKCAKIEPFSSCHHCQFLGRAGDDLFVIFILFNSTRPLHPPLSESNTQIVHKSSVHLSLDTGQLIARCRHGFSADKHSCFAAK